MRRPSFSDPALVPGLDPFRNRAARFSDSAGREGLIFVQPDLLAPPVSGHLWWTKWAQPREFVELWIQTPEGRMLDTWVTPDRLDHDLADWEQGKFALLGETFSLTWLSPEESQAVRASFGI